MAIETRIAESNGERLAIFRHRYEVYCEELSHYRDSADHRERILVEAVDDASRHAGAYLGGELVGSMRWVWGGDAPLSQAYIERYRLADLLKSIPAEQIVIGERLIVSSAHRDRDVISAMFRHFMVFVNDHRIQIVVGECEPHLLGLYLDLGFRPYSMANINSADAGYLVPLALIAEDVAYLREIRSPLAGALRDFADDARVPKAALEIVGGGSAVKSARLTTDEAYWRDLQTAYSLSGLASLHLFEGLSDVETQIIAENSTLIECRAGDRVLKKRDIARNMYVVLSGSLEVRDRDRYLATLMPGDIIGEIAFLLSTPRTADVVAMMDRTRLLSLNESTLQDLITSRPELAAKFLLNIAKLLCAKLAFRTM